MNMYDLINRTRTGAIALSLLALSGCATFSEDGGFTAVETEVRDRLGQEAKWLRNDEDRAVSSARVAELLATELTVDSAVQIALINNPMLQAEYANLGLQEAEVVQAGRLPNPGFSFGKTTGGGAQEIERGLHFSLLALLTLPVRMGIEEERFEAEKLAAIAATIEIAMEARSAYFEAVAARQTAAYA
ncbi:MAG: RND transporter, partial [Chromatiales bacterium]|nr:RND transporter [Chromatiales bacterium]